MESCQTSPPHPAKTMMCWSHIFLAKLAWDAGEGGGIVEGWKCWTVEIAILCTSLLKVFACHWPLCKGRDASDDQPAVSKNIMSANWHANTPAANVSVGALPPSFFLGGPYAVSHQIHRFFWHRGDLCTAFRRLTGARQSHSNALYCSSLLVLYVDASSFLLSCHAQKVITVG